MYLWCVTTSPAVHLLSELAQWTVQFKSHECISEPGGILMPLSFADPRKPSLSCIRELSSNNKGNGQEIRDK